MNQSKLIWLVKCMMLIYWLSGQVVCPKNKNLRATEALIDHILHSLSLWKDISALLIRWQNPAPGVAPAIRDTEIALPPELGFG